MSAHWHTNQVTIYTAVVYYRDANSEDLKHQSYAIISDDLKHDKDAVYAYNSELLKQIQAIRNTPITKLHYWSDGAAKSV